MLKFDASTLTLETHFVNVRKFTCETYRGIHAPCSSLRATKCSSGWGMALSLAQTRLLLAKASSMETNLMLLTARKGRTGARVTASLLTRAAGEVSCSTSPAALVSK